MRLILESEDWKDYLGETAVVDYKAPEISALSAKLRTEASSETEFVRAAYEYVRDRISHSADINGVIVTCRASDVLRVGEGICFAKAHLYAALLRSGGVPVGFCYQLLRLADDDEQTPLILHGLNAVYLREVSKWVRVDVRGNKEGVRAQFSIEEEQLAFPVRGEIGEKDYPYVFKEPDKNVVGALTRYSTVEELWQNLPNALCRTL